MHRISTSLPMTKSLVRLSAAERSGAKSKPVSAPNMLRLRLDKKNVETALSMTIALFLTVYPLMGKLVQNIKLHYKCILPILRQEFSHWRGARVVYLATLER